MKKIIGFISLSIITLVALVTLAATTPTLLTTDSFAILSSTYTDTSSATTIINGDLGYTTGPATPPVINGTVHVADGAYNTAGIDQGNTLVSLNNQPCDFTYGSAQDLSLLPQPLNAGVYCVIGAQSIGTGGITLKAGTYIFRSTGALNTVAGSIVSGGSACDVFWTPIATTLGANSTFKGTVIDNSGITVGNKVTWEGRALAFGGTVSTDADTITVPTCTVSTPTTPTTPKRRSSGSIPFYNLPTSTPNLPIPTPNLPTSEVKAITNAERGVLGYSTIPGKYNTATGKLIIPSLPQTGFPPRFEK